MSIKLSQPVTLVEGGSELPWVKKIASDIKFAYEPLPHIAITLHVFDEHSCRAIVDIPKNFSTSMLNLSIMGSAYDKLISETEKSIIIPYLQELNPEVIFST
jgi:hypothetical protein